MRKLSLTVLTLTVGLTLAACGSSSSGGPSAASAASAALASSSAAASAPSASASSAAASPSASASAVAGNGVSDPAAAKKQITKLYDVFFKARKAKAASLLEDGSSLGAAIKAAQKLAGTGKESSKTDAVTITGPGTASVTFDLLVNGKVALAKSDGLAVYQNGKWVVAKSTFCTLVSLGGATPKGC
jgi:hypothetical protein